MKRVLVSFIAVYLACSATMASVYGSMPVIAYMGVPNDKTSEQNFRDFRDCGFTVSLYGYSSLQQLTQACDIAWKFGIKVLGHCPETHSDPEGSALVLRDNPGFYGYVLQDEPSAEEIVLRQNEILRLKSVDDSHCFYVNLLPYYGRWVLDYTKTRSYGEYLDAADNLSCQQISFDFYPITKDGLREEWFENLNMIRFRSLKTGKPFWGFVLSVPHSMYPQPTMASLRLQVYTNLAYGAQAIEYFTYWTPEPDGQNDFHNGPISRDGRKTETYYLVQSMNKELKPIASLFYGARVTDVKNDDDTIVSHFTKNGQKYMAVINKNLKKAIKLRTLMPDLYEVKVNKDLSYSPVEKTTLIGAGDIVIFKLR